MKGLTYKIESDNPITSYVFDFLAEIFGVRLTELKSGKSDIYYGNKSSDSTMIIRLNQNHLIWEELTQGKVSGEVKVIEFDLISAIGAFLTDSTNQPLTPEKLDRHDRLKFTASFQYQNKIDHFPIINLYMQYLADALKKNFKVKLVPLWPKGKKCAIGLSHDVDNPLKTNIFRVPLSAGKTNREKMIILYQKLKMAGDILVNQNAEGYWQFTEIMDAEAKYGFKSTFYFCSATRQSEYGTQFDVDYDILSDKFKNLFRDIENRGFVTGLHTSYNAYKSERYFVKEKKRLEENAGTKIKGLRHHFWHLGSNIEKTLLEHEKAGFLYDSSIAFNDHIGFRRSVALPYQLWLGQRKSNVTEMPVFLMDGNLFYTSKNVQQSVKTVKKYISVIEKYGGIGVIDWHDRTSFPKDKKFAHWGEAYLLILKYLATKKDIWVTSPDEIYDWLARRRKKLNQ
jgi:peptidoglycan/xylan/chitin deacetylase (PgdA/CDA1 family)